MSAQKLGRIKKLVDQFRGSLRFRPFDSPVDQARTTALLNEINTTLLVRDGNTRKLGDANQFATKELFKADPKEDPEVVADRNKNNIEAIRRIRDEGERET